MTEKTSTRAYRSALRTEQAAETRRRVLEAAAACFAEQGYAGTSLPQIGARAGVSTETVKANGPKRNLLLAAFEQAFAGAEGDELIADSEEGRRIIGIRDPELLLRTGAELVAAANARTSTLWTELLSAANADAEIAAALAALLDRRRQDYLGVARLLMERGIARADLDADVAAAVLSFAWSPESHQQLVLQSGWDMPRYERWLVDAARRLLG